MIYKNSILAINENEIALVPKNIKKLRHFLRDFFNYLASFVFSGNISCFLKIKINQTRN